MIYTAEQWAFHFPALKPGKCLHTLQWPMTLKHVMPGALPRTMKPQQLFKLYSDAE